MLARHLYEALTSGDAGSLRKLLHPSFTGRAAEGLPLGLGGDYDGPEAMTQDFWWAIGRHYRARAEPGQFLPLADRWPARARPLHRYGPRRRRAARRLVRGMCSNSPVGRSAS